MSSVTLQLFDTLDAFKALHDVGENPSPAEIREMFRLLDGAKAEHAPDMRNGLRTALEPHVAVDEFDQDAPNACRAGAGSSRTAEDPARGNTSRTPTLDEVAGSLERAIAKAAPRRKASARKRAS